MKIRELFVEDVTRSIPPVVYFHQQSPESLAAEVGEYIITGGWNEDHPNHRRVPNGIHEQYVKLLRGIAREMDKDGGPDLPNVGYLDSMARVNRVLQSYWDYRSTVRRCLTAHRSHKLGLHAIGHSASKR